MTKKLKRRPRDPIQLAKLIGDIATGQVQDEADNGPNPVASEYMRQGGLKGGRARAEKLTPMQRAEIARVAALARWKKSER